MKGLFDRLSINCYNRHDRTLYLKAQRLWSILKLQTDDTAWNGTSEYGIYYSGTLFFFVLGIFYCIKTSIEKSLEIEKLLSFSCWFRSPAVPDINATCILNQNTDLTPFEQAGFTLHTYNFYTVAHYDQ